MWPATPSSKPNSANSRNAAARRSLRWRRSSAGVANTGGRGTRSMKALRAGEAAEDDGCGMRTSFEKGAQGGEGIVHQGDAVVKRNTKRGTAKACGKEDAPEKPGRFAKKVRWTS